MKYLWLLLAVAACDAPQDEHAKVHLPMCLGETATWQLRGLTIHGDTAIAILVCTEGKVEER